MEQQDNVIDRDIELSVVLPGDVIKSTTVNGSKPMMDLLVYLCAQYHLNPSSHFIDVVSAEKKQIKFKSNTPIGILEVDTVFIKPKLMDKKKSTPVIPEQTVRVVINYKKTQKTIVRVSPHAPLEELLHIICSKCDFDPLQTLLMKSYQSQEVLDWTKSLNELGLRELYAMNVSKATPNAEFNLSSLQDSCQNSQNMEKENKGFFSFFQRSKKKREQTASAPATPLMSKPRPAFVIKSNTISKQYDSNTLPSEMPKKRRAPLPPMPASRSVPQDLAQTQDRHAACVVKSSSVDETDKGLSRIGIVRTGSLQLSGTSSVNSSLRRTKRKAPSPPPRKLQGQSDNSIGTGSESAESIHTEGAVKERHLESPPADIGSEYSLEEIDEKEEMREERADTPLKIQENPTPFSAPIISAEFGKSEPASLASDSKIGAGDNVKDPSEGKTENMSTDEKAHHSWIANEKATLDEGTLQPNKNNGHSGATVLPVAEERKTNAVEGRERNTLEAERLPNSRVYHIDICLSKEHSPQEHLGVHGQKCEQSNLEPVKTQDVAIQASPPVYSFDQTALSERTDTQECKMAIHKGSAHMQKPAVEHQPSEFLNRLHETVGTMTEFSHQGQQAVDSRESLGGNQNNTCANDNHSLPQRVVKSPVSSPTKGYPLYRQDAKPKPKPSNEITRDYIPKVGMTTYKIVPPKSLEMLKNWESDTVGDQEAACLHVSPNNENAQEFGTQTEIPNVLKSPSQARSDFGHEVHTLPGNDPLRKTYSVVDDASAFLPNASVKKVEHSKPDPDHVIAQVALSSEKKSRSPPAVHEKPSILSPASKPSNFYLQMQRRASGHYVTSAVARSGSVSSPTPNEAKSIETDKKLASPDQTAFPFPRTVNAPSQSVEEKTENGHSENKTKASTAPPVKMPKPLSSPPSQPPTLNLKTLRTFVVPQPYSSSRPSPFALAVSSAVKRSQSFSKTSTSTSRPLKGQYSLDLPSSMASTDAKNHPPLQSPTGESQQSVTEEKNNCASSEQSRQVPSLSGHPTTTLCERGIAVALQRPDPEQIHQSLLAAIRSGEAAAKLRRVGPPSNTVAINGRPSLNSSVSVEARYNNH